MSVLSKLICRFIAVSISFPADFDNLVFAKIDKVIKFIWNYKGIRIAENNFEEEEQI